MLRRSPLWANLPVVVLTGADDRDHLISRAWELGVSDLVPKATFGFEDLLGRVRQHLPPPVAVRLSRRQASPRRGASRGARLGHLVSG